MIDLHLTDSILPGSDTHYWHSNDTLRFPKIRTIRSIWILGDVIGSIYQFLCQRIQEQTTSQKTHTMIQKLIIYFQFTLYKNFKK